MSKAIVTVSGGIAEAWHEPEGVDVHVIDFDCLEADFADHDTFIEQADLLEEMDGLLTALMEETSASTAHQWEKEIAEVRERMAPEALEEYEARRKDEAYG